MTYINAKEILEESIPVLTICVTISVFSGLFLNKNTELLKFLPGLLIIMPSFIAVNGNISSVLTSRLSSALHMGLIKPNFRRTKILLRNIYSMLIVSMVSFPVLGFVAAAANSLFGASKAAFVIFPLITFTAGMITVLLLIFASILFSYVTYRKGLDPDTVVIHLLTTTGDLVGIVVLLVVTGMMI